jgi:hypothetical protein
MTRNRIIAISSGGIITVATFVAGLWLMIYGNMFPDSDLIFLVSMAISPLAVVSVIAGFLVWWIFLFLLTLIWNDSPTEQGDELNK